MASLKNEPSQESFFDSAEEVDFSLSPDSGIHDFSKMDPSQKDKMTEKWESELEKTEEEINTLRQVLTSKIKKMQDLKRKLGITPWNQFKGDMEQGLQNIRETNYYQKTSQTLKTASEKTSEALGTLGASMSKTFEGMKQSAAYKSLEEKVGTAYSNVKTKVSGSSLSKSSTNEKNEDPLIEKSNGSQIPAEIF